NQVKPALLVIDIQNEYLKYMSEYDKKWGMEIINGAIYMFRQHNLPIIRVYHTDPVIKNFGSAFQKTELDKILKEKGCNTLYLCGLSAVGCVLATYFGGMERDYKVFMVKEGIMSHNSDYTRVIKDISETVSFETMVFMLGNLK
ncbi:MAG: isochorismatase family protein, partial [bacterium]|nr:isochorismatase family protein [bacterium]